MWNKRKGYKRESREPRERREQVALGVVLSMIEALSGLFSRSFFKVYALYFTEVATLVVAGVEYAIGAAFLLIVAYRSHLLRAVGLGKGRRLSTLRLTKRLLVVMAGVGLCNILGRGFSALALDADGMTIALFNAIGFSVPVLLFSIEGWKKHRRAAVIVPVSIVAGLAVAGEVWESSASLVGIGWAFACALCGLLYLPLSRSVLEEMDGAQQDQFQAINTCTGAVGLLVWAALAGKDFAVGWSWDLVGVLCVTAFLGVVVPRRLHIRARMATGDALYTVLRPMSLLLALGVDFLVEGTVPGVWQVVGYGVVGIVALAAALHKVRAGVQTPVSGESPTESPTSGTIDRPEPKGTVPGGRRLGCGLVGIVALVAAWRKLRAGAGRTSSAESPESGTTDRPRRKSSVSADWRFGCGLVGIVALVAAWRKLRAGAERTPVSAESTKSGAADRPGRH